MSLINLRVAFGIFITCVALSANALSAEKEPFVSMEEAGEMAEIHLHKNGVDIANHYKASAAYRQATEQAEPVWRIEWRPKLSGEIKTLGGGIVVYIHAEGKTQHVFDD